MRENSNSPGAARTRESERDNSTTHPARGKGARAARTLRIEQRESKHGTATTAHAKTREERPPRDDGGGPRKGAAARAANGGKRGRTARAGCL